MTIRALTLAALLATSARAETPWPLETFEDVQAEWIRVTRPLPVAPSKCFDVARWACAAGAIAARSRQEEPDVQACFRLLDSAREMDREPRGRRQCAASFKATVKQARDFESAVHEAARANGGNAPKPARSLRAVVRTVPFMALLASAFRKQAG